MFRAILCKNQTKWEMKNFDPPTQICTQVASIEFKAERHASYIEWKIRIALP